MELSGEELKKLLVEKMSFLEKKREEVLGLLGELNDVSALKDGELRQASDNLRSVIKKKSQAALNPSDAPPDPAKLNEILKEEGSSREKWASLEMEAFGIRQSVTEVEDLNERINLALNILKADPDDFIQGIHKYPLLQSVGVQVLSALEEERKRIARDIHDGPAQSFANVVLRLDLCDKLLSQDLEKGKQELKELQNLVKESLNQVRRFIFNLRPMTLDDLGLTSTLKKFMQDFQQHHSIKTDLFVIGGEQRLDRVYEVTLFRIVQEALNNVAKHSQAKNVRVTLDADEDYVTVGVKDDGKGFPSEHMMATTSKRQSLGLVSMKERAELLGGTFSVKSSSSEGTSLVVRVPLRKGTSAEEKP